MAARPTKSPRSSSKPVKGRPSRQKPIRWEVDPDTGCWNCVSHRRRSGDGGVGYPVAQRDGRKRRISRMFYEKYVGPIPDGLFILHSCDNPGCINPDHLRPGTNADNTRDKVLRGRQARLLGERCGKSRLTRVQVLEIRANETDSDEVLAKHYGVHSSTIGHARRGRTWPHLPFNRTAIKNRDTVMRGSKHVHAKLTEDDVIAIRRDKDSSLLDVSERYGIAISTVSEIRNGKKWKHVPLNP